jgi:hypothetical protein
MSRICFWRSLIFTVTFCRDISSALFWPSQFFWHPRAPKISEILR